jgi:carbon storage regulator
MMALGLLHKLPPSAKEPRQPASKEAAMLVLSRSNRQRIVFPSLGISVEILEIAGSHVRIGIDAPKSIPVHRSEVADRIYREELRHEHPR